MGGRRHSAPRQLGNNRATEQWNIDVGRCISCIWIRLQKYAAKCNYLKSNLNLCNFLLKRWVMEMLYHFTRSHTLQNILTISLNEGQSFLAVFLISYQILKERNIYPPWPGTKERKVWQNNWKIFLNTKKKRDKSKTPKKKKKFTKMFTGITQDITAEFHT